MNTPMPCLFACLEVCDIAALHANFCVALTRDHEGLIHPFIHLGFGLEFNQPAIIAQALAETAVHDARIAPFLLRAEKAAEDLGKPNRKLLIQLQDEVRADEKLRKSAHYGDDNKIYDGVMNRAPEEMIKYASQYSVAPDQMEEKLAEQINAVGEASKLPPPITPKQKGGKFPASVCQLGSTRFPNDIFPT